MSGARLEQGARPGGREGVERLVDVRRPRRLGPFLLLALLALAVALPAADEDGLLELWKKHLATPDDHDAVTQACRDFATAHPGDPLLPVVRGFEEWHALRAGRQDEAFKMIEADLVAPPGPVTDGARRLALGWLTRQDREKVVVALRAYHRKEIAYPKSLEQLAAHPKLKLDPKPPYVDRFGKSWSYQLTGFAKLKGFADQNYALRSTALGEVSDIKSALRVPYGSRIQGVPVQMIPGNNPAVKFNIAGNAAIVGVGQASGDLHLAFVGAKILVVCDYTHWKILSRP